MTPLSYNTPSGLLPVNLCHYNTQDIIEASSHCQHTIQYSASSSPRSLFFLLLNVNNPLCSLQVYQTAHFLLHSAHCQYTSWLACTVSCSLSAHCVACCMYAVWFTISTPFSSLSEEYLAHFEYSWLCLLFVQCLQLSLRAPFSSLPNCIQLTVSTPPCLLSLQHISLCLSVTQLVVDTHSLSLGGGLEKEPKFSIFSEQNRQSPLKEKRNDFLQDKMFRGILYISN